MVDAPATARRRALVGILTNRDVRFADDPRQPVSELMTRKVITVGEGVGQDEARRLLHQHRIEKLVVIDESFRCVGLVTVKDIEKATAHPQRRQGSPRGGCASPPPPRSATRGSSAPNC